MGSEFYYFGAATVVASLLDWCEHLEKEGIENISIKELRNGFKIFYEYNANVKKYIERIENDYKK